MKKIIMGAIIAGTVAGITTAIVKKIKKKKVNVVTMSTEDDEIASVFEDIKEGLQEAIDYEKNNKDYSTCSWRNPVSDTHICTLKNRNGNEITIHFPDQGSEAEAEAEILKVLKKSKI